MRVRTLSACVALAWGILLLLAMAGPFGPLRPAQVNTRTANTISVTSIASTTRTTIPVTLTVSAATIPVTLTGARTYRVQPGDTLAGIAAALGIPGGWPALYTANRRAIGPDPGLIRPGSILTLPGPAAPTRYTVAAGDTLTGIAVALAIPGGWPALYIANRQQIGPDPSQLQTGTVLAIPHPTPLPSAAGSSRPSPSASHPARPTRPASPPTKAQPSATATAPAPATAPATKPAPPRSNGQQHPPLAHRPGQAQPAATGGLPRWLEIVLIAAGLLIAIAFLTEPALAIARRRRGIRSGATSTRIVLADYDRLVVTHCRADDTVCVLRPPDVDPQAILLAARLVLAQDRYEELAGHLGVPAHWPRE